MSGAGAVTEDDLSQSVRDLILSLHAPEWTPEFEALHEQIRAAKADGSLTDELLNRCTECECIVCGALVCPRGEPLHFHHDGCPACETT